MTEHQNQDSNLKLLSDITVYSKDARFLPELNRRESWEEIVTRNKEMHIRKFPFLAKEIENIYRDFVLTKKVLPSRRSIQFAGKPIELSNNRLYNCFGRETKFVTSDGVKSFNDFNDGEQITILTHLGNWKKAIVKNYGQQKLKKINFTRNNSHAKIVWATENHRWILRDGTETTNLKKDQYVMSAPNLFDQFEFDSADPFEKLYWCYGYVFGDGTKVKKNGEYTHSMVRLCDHERNHITKFEEMGFISSRPLSCKGDYMVYTGRYLKTAPDPNIDSPALIRAFVHGYLAADGGKSVGTASKYRNIQATGKKYIDFIRSCFPIAGVFISSEQDVTDRSTNFGERSDTTIRFVINTNLASGGHGATWRVQEISEEEKIEDVWCLEVEDDHSFVLDFGAVTGNCSYTVIDNYYVFAEVMFLLLGGSGVGFSVQNRHISKLPPIQKPIRSRRYLIADSIEGWADAVKILIKAYLCNGPKPNFDFSDIRKKGTPLKTSGGKAPGPQPLKDCLYNLEKILSSKENGEQLKSIEVHDMVCHIADAVLAGGIRRAALISLFDMDDEDMISCKSGNWWELNPQRGRANNSAVIVRHKVTEFSFFELWKKIRASGSGEPGFYFTNDPDWGCNPSLRKGTKVLTDSGIFPIEELENKYFNVRNLNGEWSKARCRMSGTGKRLYKISLEGGHEYYCTAEHEWPIWNYEVQKFEKKKTTDLKKNDKLPIIKNNDLFSSDLGEYEQGWLLGRSFAFRHEDHVIQQFQNIWKLSEQFRKGMIDAICFNCGNFYINNNYISKIDFLFKNNQLASEFSELLGFYGIKNIINKNDVGLFVEVNNHHCILHYLKLFKSFRNKDSENNELEQDLIENTKNLRLRSSNTIQILSIDETNLYEDVWDISVYDDTHCFQINYSVTGNCCEIGLRPNSFCNLDEVNMSDIESQEDLNARVRAAAFLGTLQASYTNFHYLRDIWRRNGEKEALLGVGGTGIASQAYLKCDLEEAARIVKEENERVAKLIGINPAARLTCVKPAGTTSCVLGTSSGIHAWFDKFYIRRLEFNKIEPIYQFLMARIPELMEDHLFRPHQSAFLKIPIKAPKDAITAPEETAFQLLERIKYFSQHWIKPGHVKGENTHNVSATVYIKEHEWDDVGNWMWNNREHYNGLAVLPFDGGTYTQTPFESITEEEYERLSKFLEGRDLDFREIYEDTDETNLAGEVACAGGACEIK